MRNHYGHDRNYLIFAPEVTPSQRVELGKQTDLTCEMCGIGPGQIDSDTGLRALLHVERARWPDRPQFHFGCSICITGRHDMGAEQPWFEVASQIRRAGIEEQRAVFDWLRKKFKE